MSVAESAPPVAAAPELRPPRASVIILTYNSRTWLDDLFASLAQTRGDFEVVVADNESTDGSLERAGELYPSARLVRNGGNFGYAGGNNRAAAVARGEFLVFLNPDVTVEPGWLDGLLAPFANPQVGLTTARVRLLREPQLLNSSGTDVHLSGLTLCRGMSRPQELFDQPGEVAAVAGAACAARREVFAAVGGFNERFFMYMEDTALSLEAVLAGWRCEYAPGSVVYHDYRLRFGPRKVLYQERNRYWMLLQLYRWPTLVGLLPTLLLAEVVTWGFVLTRDRANWRNKFRAVAEVWRDRRAILARRRRIQSLRRVPDRHLLARCTHRLDFGQVNAGGLSRLAGLVFNPLFWLLRGLTLAVVRW
jgi:GT2 family glycosyltransferase